MLYCEYFNNLRKTLCVTILIFWYGEIETYYYMILRVILLYCVTPIDSFLKLNCEWRAFSLQYYLSNIDYSVHILSSFWWLVRYYLLPVSGVLPITKISTTLVTVYSSYLLWKSRRNWRGIVVCPRKTAIGHGIRYTSQASFSPCS